MAHCQASAGTAKVAESVNDAERQFADGGGWSSPLSNTLVVNMIVAAQTGHVSVGSGEDKQAAPSQKQCLQSEILLVSESLQFDPLCQHTCQACVCE